MIAIYARQSVERKDSISIESQISACKAKIPHNNTEKIEVYIDRGATGGNTNRPAYKRMAEDILSGRVSKIIVYKVDRLSRNLLDFLKMKESFFEKHGVKFISVSEDFDTSTATGEMMMNIIMMFAENERKTIQKRVTDNYYARGEQGFYLGGYAPFGYAKIETRIGNKKTYTFEENEDESELLHEIYLRYLDGESLAAIARWLNEKGISTRKNKAWNAIGVGRVLRNPVYVKANVAVYKYLKEQGATINNDVGEFIGENGCMVYGKASERSSVKFSDYSTDYVTLGMHKGLIEPSRWLAVQAKFGEKTGHSNLGTGSLTWLQGLLRCGCGYSFYVKRVRTKKKEHLYIYCRGRRNGTCSHSEKLTPVYIIEEIVEERLLAHLRSLKDLSDERQDTDDNAEINKLNIKIVKAREQIAKLIDLVAESSDVTAGYINEKITELDKEIKLYENEINNIVLETDRKRSVEIDIDDVLGSWGNYDIEERKRIARLVIDRVVISGNTVDVVF